MLYHVRIFYSLLLCFYLYIYAYIGVVVAGSYTTFPIEPQSSNMILNCEPDWIVDVISQEWPLTVIIEPHETMQVLDVFV